MAASALALILLSNRLPFTRRASIISAVVLVLVITGGLITRSTLPAAPDSYEAMVRAASG